jgi:hypothetical protein
MLTSFFITMFGVALASELPEIAVVGLHVANMDEASQLDANDALAAAIRKTDRARPFLGIPLLDMLEGHEDEILKAALVRPGAQQFQDGRRLYNQAQAAGAIPVLRQAIASLTEAMRIADAGEPLWMSWMVLAACHLAVDEPQMAEFAVGQALALDSERQVDPTQFAPALLRLHEQMKERGTKVRAWLEVRAANDEASLWLDGSSVGRTPLEVQVYPGTHHLRARGIDGRRDTQILNLAPEEEFLLELNLQPPRLVKAPDSPFARARQIDLLYRGISEHSQAELVLLVGVSGKQLQLQIYDARVGAWSQPTSVPFSGDPVDEAVTAIPLVLGQLDILGEMSSDAASVMAVDAGTNRWITHMLLERGSGQLRRMPAVAPEADTHKPLPKWVVPAAIGGGAAVLATVAVVAVVASRPPPTDPVEENQGVVVFGPIP